jgi:hypothetical protein
MADRRKLAEQLLELQIEISPTLQKIDDIKEKLRAICVKEETSFKEEVEGKGTVEVRAGTEPEFKGLMPELQYKPY